MNKASVERTVQLGLCCSCGLCKGVCPQNCIQYVRQDGCYRPSIDSEKCIHCGICTSICPGLEMSFPKKKTPLECVYGEIKECFNAWSKDSDLRHVSASGGVVSSIVNELLINGSYDVAFCVDTYNYEQQLKTRSLTRKQLPDDWKDSTLPKSRYLSVSHENAAKFLRENPDKRVILIGNSCAVQGFRKLIKQYHLADENYLLLGLFCDKVFNYNINDYYQKTFACEKTIKELHFKNKESGGWPGNIKFIYSDGSTGYLDKSERSKVKDYFMPERCLYCVDKLNVCADISVGDNYTGQNTSPLGSNTVLIRTETGWLAWEKNCAALEFEAVAPEKLAHAQYLEGRLNNLQFSALKQRQIQKRSGSELSINQGMPVGTNYREFEQAWKHALGKLHAGEVYREDPQELERQFRLAEKRKNPKDPVRLAERAYYALKRRIK